VEPIAVAETAPAHARVDVEQLEQDAAEAEDARELEPEPEPARSAKHAMTMTSFYAATPKRTRQYAAETSLDSNDGYADYDDDDDDQDEVVSVDARPYMQNRELSWLTFDERVLDQGADESVPLLERLNFISIFWSNLQEFFMVRVGSLTDLSFINPPIIDSKTGMTAEEQIKAIHERCRELYPIQESYYEHVRGSLSKEGVRHLRPDDLSDEQRNYLSGFVKFNVEPFLSPQIINPRHPFPHLENGKLYILVRLDDEADAEERKKDKKGKKKKKDKGGAAGVVLGLIPLPHQCDRIIKLPGRGFQFILLEHAIEMFASEIFSMYKIKHTNVICVTRNADIDANQAGDEQDDDYREHMRRLLKKRARLAPVRLECERPLSPVMEKHMLKKLGLKRSQVYDTIVPLDLSFTWGLGSRLSESKRAKLSNPPFNPAWPKCFDHDRRIMDQLDERDILLSYPYESMDPFVQLLKEAAFDPTVVSIKITLYRLASQSQLAEALITAAENGKDVTALFELRARFDESNNIEWSQRFEQAGCNVIYGFRDYKVHSKICCITRMTDDGVEHITQLGTGNYNEKTARLYTDLSFITKDEAFGRDAVEFFRNMQLENVSDNYEVLRVAPLQIKSMILENLDRQIFLARQGKPCGAFLKANSITDKEVIEKIAEASREGVGITLFIRGICCLLPEVKGATENVRVVSIVGRLLEHSRIYCFGTPEDCRIYLSSADLMTRNLNKRVEIAWPIQSEEIRWRILEYIDTCMNDTAKLRELRPNATYTPLGAFCDLDEDGNSQPPFDAQAALIERAAGEAAASAEVEEPAAAEDAFEEAAAVQEPIAVEETAAPIEEAASAVEEIAVPAEEPIAMEEEPAVEEVLEVEEEPAVVAPEVEEEPEAEEGSEVEEALDPEEESETIEEPEPVEAPAYEEGIAGETVLPAVEGDVEAFTGPQVYDLFKGVDQEAALQDAMLAEEPPVADDALGGEEPEAVPAVEEAPADAQAEIGVLDFSQFEVQPTTLPEGFAPPAMDIAPTVDAGQPDELPPAEDLTALQEAVAPQDAAPVAPSSSLEEALASFAYDAPAPAAFEAEPQVAGEQPSAGAAVPGATIGFEMPQPEGLAAEPSALVEDSADEVPLTEMTLDEILLDLPELNEPEEPEPAPEQSAAPAAGAAAPMGGQPSAGAAQTAESAQPRQQPASINGLPPDILEHVINKAQILAAQSGRQEEEEEVPGFFDKQDGTIEMPPDRKGFFRR
jgi:polyphosphate kinase